MGALLFVEQSEWEILAERCTALESHRLRKRVATPTRTGNRVQVVSATALPPHDSSRQRCSQAYRLHPDVAEFPPRLLASFLHGTRHDCRRHELDNLFQERIR